MAIHVKVQTDGPNSMYPLLASLRWYFGFVNRVESLPQFGNDGFHHGMPERRLPDGERAKFLASLGLRCCGSGIGGGVTVGKVCCWRSGMRSTGGLVVCRW